VDLDEGRAVHPRRDLGARSMPRARRVIVPAAGHLAHFEEPALFNDLVLSEIEALNGGRG
jgi:pimeloyl-ACP methyl ester carboxylesterase